MNRPVRIGVIGSGRSHPKWDEWAEAVGRGIAEAGAEGVMFTVRVESAGGLVGQLLQ